MRKRMKMMVAVMMLCILSFAGCGKKQAEQGETPTKKPVNTEADATKAPTAAATKAATATPEPTATKAPEPTATKAPVELILPKAVNDSGKVLIQTASMNTSYPYNTYVITSKDGETVVIDPTQMPAAKFVDFQPAVIISTHSHSDHTDNSYVGKNPDSKVVLYTEEDFSTRDFHIYTVMSSHNENDPLNNAIVILEVDGLRIAHLGDIGQTELTKEQLTKIGKIDIAFMQFENSYSGMSLKNEKGFHIIEQLTPKIVIPTHFTAMTWPALEERYGEITEFKNFMTISAEELPETELNIYRIFNQYKYR